MTRTLPQNNSFHLWLDRLADALNEAGYSVNDKLVIKTDIPFTKENLKASIVHVVMKKMYPDIDSTAKLSTTQIQDVYEVVNEAIALRTAVHVPWPTEEQL